ncbi:hypothetical protein M2403_001996 [Rahnella sp. BIGb0603]|uniref:hypothetical protein n=1 Tax=Rahnella sp. BIGb0603 TaxID=2940612 RepID=UPI0021683348|nr:hypothetical protein [Rahnella sp. BIGb0603]MCS3423395.1 hypothetical protein [Rahnella sp. BIGb0603]
MTDTTDIKALLNELRVTSTEKAGESEVARRVLILFDQLEAERQRADNYEQMAHGLATELEALKGDQVPVAEIVVSKNWPDVGRKVIDYYLEKIQHLPVGTQLFTAPQKKGSEDAND